MSSGKIIVQLGSDQAVFNDMCATFSDDCDLIENIVSCNKSELSKNGGSGRIRFLDHKGDLVVQLSIVRENTIMSDESGAIVVIRSKGGFIRSNAYFGVKAELDFKSDSKEYSMSGVKNHVESIKRFYKSWQVKKGSISAVVIIVDDKDIFDEVIKDSFFDNCYVLLAE